MVRLTDRPDMTLDVYRGRKTTIQQQQPTEISEQKKSPAHIRPFKMSDLIRVCTVRQQFYNKM